MELKIQEIKTVGDVWAIYDAAGISRPSISQELMFKNAETLKKLLDRITELEGKLISAAERLYEVVKNSDTQYWYEKCTELEAQRDDLPV